MGVCNDFMDGLFVRNAAGFQRSLILSDEIKHFIKCSAKTVVYRVKIACLVPFRSPPKTATEALVNLA